MSIVTSQQLARYFEQYMKTEVTFNMQVAGATGLISRNIYLKIQDRRLPCVILSSSMAGARVIASVSPEVSGELDQANGRLTLRWCFKLPDKDEPIAFFVACHAANLTPYATKDPDMQLVTLEYTQRPADDLILILGMLLDANANAHRRKDERIVVSPETMKKLGLDSREAALVVEHIGYRCALRDISFSGAMVFVVGSTAAFAEKHIALKISRGALGADILLAGIVRRAEEVGGHKDVLALGIEYEGDIPMSYKLLISTYLSSVRKAPEVPNG